MCTMLPQWGVARVMRRSSNEVCLKNGGLKFGPPYRDCWARHISLWHQKCSNTRSLALRALGFVICSSACGNTGFLVTKRPTARAAMVSSASGDGNQGSGIDRGLYQQAAAPNHTQGTSAQLTVHDTPAGIARALGLLDCPRQERALFTCSFWAMCELLLCRCGPPCCTQKGMLD